ncbi:MAG: bifunctional riboflavin kinase/FAD synthetase [Chitinophagaceae bacterium]
MQVHYDLNLLPKFENAVITIGSFDGVHVGHQKIIAQLKKEAKKINGETVIITFHPHPRKIVHQNLPLQLLTTLPEKIELLEAKKIDHLVIIPFNENFSNQTPEEYIQHFLFEKFHPHTVIIGYDHRFGKDRKGDYHLLEDCGKTLGFEVKEIPEQVLNEVIISSTRIREALLQSDIETANKFLGYDYFFEGKVVEGNKLGRELGYPTANILVEDAEKLIPANGVYALKAEVNRQPSTFNVFQGMMSIGIRPTIGGTPRTIEVNIFDFDKNIYNETLRVYVKYFLRDEIKFDGLDALKNQLAKDKEETIKKLNTN